MDHIEAKEASVKIQSSKTDRSYCLIPAADAELNDDAITQIAVICDEPEI